MKLIVTIFVVLLTNNVHAKTWGPAKAAPPGFDRKAQLEELYQKLGEAKNQFQSRVIFDQLWQTFMTAPDEDAAEYLNRALRARGGYNYEKATKILDELIEKYPTYEEGWNQRAYVNFLRKRYNLSIEDCHKVFELDPRHLGCLSGVARILIRQHKDYVAGERFLKEAVRLHPYIYEKILFKEIPKTNL